MIKLYILLAAAVALAWFSEQYQWKCQASGQPYRLSRDWAYCALLAILILFSGLRTSYNDTGTYLAGYANATGLRHFLENSSNLNPFRNPLFYAYQSLLRSTLDNAQFLIFSTSLFSQICFLRFFKRYSTNFTLSVFIYITLGTFCFTMAAIKQVVAMAVLTLAFPFLEQRKYIRYFLLVYVAMLFHTYALTFIFLPLFTDRPWKPFTYIFIALTFVILLNFQDAISAFMDQANDLGKVMSEAEIFDNHSVNIFRLLVYMVPPAASLLFQRWLFYDSDQMDHILVHMSIISMAFMFLGTESGANMFGRMATYFELGTICCLPRMLEKIFDKASYRLVRKIAVFCFLGYFTYAYGISMNFSTEYSAMSLWTFIRSMLS